MDEREGVNASKPTYVLTRLGLIASGGRVEVRSNSHKVLKARVNVDCDTSECEQLRREITKPKAALRQVELEEEETQPSRSKELACSFVEPNVKVKDGYYEVSIPLRPDIVKKIPNNVSNALERTMCLRRKALSDPTLNQTLTDTFQELLSEGWLTHVEKVNADGPTWYVSFFVTKQKESLVALKWIVNPDLHLPRFEKRRVDKIHLITSACDWNYVQGSLNPADVGTREGSVRSSDSFALWLRGPPFLLQGSLEPKPVSPSVVVRSASINVNLLPLKSNTCLDWMIKGASDLFTLKKRVTYLIALKQHIVAKLQKRNLCESKLDADYFDNAFMDVVKFIQRTHFWGHH